MVDAIRVLHVDDDPEMGEVTAEWLEHEDDRFEVVTARGPDDALDRLRGTDVDCVVSDYDMPGMDGLEFLDAVREEYPDLPFVLFTGKGSEEIASRAISAGVTDYLQKGTPPETYAVLANRVENAVDGYRQQRRLESERRRFSLLFENLTQPTVEVEYEGAEPIVKRVNPAFEERFGYDRETLVGESLDDYIVPEGREEEAREINDRVREGGELFGTEVRRMTADGPREFLLQNAVYPDGSGGFAVYTDVTDAKERQRELERRQDLLRYTEQLADTGGWEFDPRTGELRWTDGTRRIHGVDEDYEPVVDEAVEFYHPDDRATITEALDRAIETGEPYDLELRIRTADGERRWIRTMGRPIVAGGEVTKVRGAIRDITERKERERAREQAEAKYRRLVEQNLVGIYIIQDGEFAYVNPTLAEVFGYEQEEVLGMTPFDLVVEEDYDLLEENLRKRVEGEVEDIQYTLRGVRKDGERIRVEVHGGRIEHEGEPAVMGALVDVTERHRQRRELERQNERLNKVVNVLSHDLRNPLNVARGSVELAVDEYDDDDLRRAERALGRMATLVDDLLTVARHGRAVEDPEPTDLASVADSCWRNVATGRADLRVATDATVVADRSRLHQVFENLFRNAAEHGVEDVTVTVGTLDDDAGFYVEDDGPGIPPEERDRVFEAGYSTDDDSTGFGLDIVSEIVDAHGWEVRVTGSESGGARFEITGVDVRE